MKNKKLVTIIIIFAIIILAVFGVTYAYLTYFRTGANNKLITGELYLRLTNNTDTIEISNVFPETALEARSHANNQLTFSVTGKNQSKKDDVYYEIMLKEGASVSGKTRFNVEDLRFDLVEIVNNQEVFLVNAATFDTINGKRIWVDTVSRNTTNEITRTYKLRMWLDSDVIISDTDPNSDYSTASYKNRYASVKVAVSGDLEYKYVS